MHRSWMTLLALAVLAAGCGGGGAATPPEEPGGGAASAPAAITLSHTAAAVVAGGTLQLSATPVDAEGRAVAGLPAPSWSTANPAVATVSATGVVTAVGPGAATVTATLTAGGVTRTASAAVTVAPRAPAFAALTLSPATGAVAVGGTLALTATPRDAAGQPVAGLPAATFSTSGAAVATVSAAGVATGVAPGTATITATLTAGGATHTATALVTVTPGTPPPSGGSNAVVRGLEHAFAPASVTIPVGGTVTWTMVDDEHDVTWTGAAPTGGNIPRMDEGESATRAFPVAGTFTYRCVRHEKHNETGTVVVQGSAGGAVLTSVSVAPGTAQLAVGATAQLQAAALDAGGQPMAGLPAASWSSSDAARATVSATGVVTGVAAGTATITASITSGGVTRTGTAAVTVTAGSTPPPPPPPASPSPVVTTPGTAFAPALVTIGVGATVTWEISGATHNVTFGAAAPPGGNIPDARTGSVSRQFTAAGTYDYQCTRHAGMQGRVVVQ